MGIYIKKKMPQNCKDCDILMDCEYHKQHHEWDKRRNENCPMIEVKTPFGELVNRVDIPVAFWAAVRRSDDPYTQVKMIEKGPIPVLPGDDGDYEPRYISREEIDSEIEIIERRTR